ncbi:9863_t:CDS:2 [Ambispora leptoticha]|uniref:9863_t:CDS:1 n=1 Tax=Ambispora leptoticha TaxID=144679 RepID=A0A9N9B5T4_9GLOM|nr:9863_t:CDS:2 [Ambispora leptoticha]
MHKLLIDHAKKLALKSVLESNVTDANKPSDDSSSSSSKA